MLTAPRSSFTPARTLKGSFSEPRLIGFLNANRRILVLGAIASCGLLTSIPSLPAQADAFFGTADVSIPLQS